MILKKKYLLSLFIFLTLFLFLNPSVFVSNSNEQVKFNPEKDSKLAKTSKNIVTANSIISDIVSNIIQENPTVIVNGAEDPHTYEPTVGEVQALVDADIIFRLGLEEVEPWWKTEWEDATVVKLVDENMLKIDPLLGEDNPHVWMDPNNIINFTKQVNYTMCIEEPSYTNWFSGNASIYINMLQDLLIQIDLAEDTFNSTALTVYHPAFIYFFDLLGIERVATIEEGEGKEPSASHIQDVIDEMNEHDAHLIVVNPQHRSDTVYEIARSTNSKIASLTPLLGVSVNWNGTQKTISTYEELIEYDLWALANPVDPPLIPISWFWFLIGGFTIAGVIGAIIIIKTIIGKRK